MSLRVLSGGAAQGLIESLRAGFETDSGRKIDGTFGAVGAMRDRLLGGAPCDLVILTRALVDELARQGHVVAGSAADIGTVETAVAVRQGDARPSIGDADALRAALLASDAIHFPDPQQATAGIHFAKVIRELGIWTEVEGRLRTAPNGATAMRALAAEKSARPIGCTQTTEILPTPGLALVGPLPAGCALATVYTAGVCVKAEAALQAREFVARLCDPKLAATRRQLGFA